MMNEEKQQQITLMETTLIPTTTNTLFSFTLKPHFFNLTFYSSSSSLKPTKRTTFLFSSSCSYTRRRRTSIRADNDFNLRSRKRRKSSPSNVVKEPKSSYGFLEELLDSIWIFKVFRFYGWWLPPVFISMLLATGPKAFLLALAVPTGLSIVALPLNKLWGIINDPKREKPKKKTKKKPHVRTKSDVDIEEEWVPNYKGKRNDGGEDSSSFKGWDELDKPEEFDEERMRRPVRGGRLRGEGRFFRREGGG